MTIVFLAHPNIKKSPKIRIGLSTPLTDIIEAASLVCFIRDQENKEQASSRG